MFLSHFESSVDLANDASVDSIIITGKFNDKCTLLDDNHYASELKRRFYDIVQTKGMSQLVNQPTRVSADGLSHSLLDLIITNSPGKAVDCDVLPPISHLDHCNIISKFSVSSCLNHNYKRTVWDLKNANMVALNDALLNAPWDVGFDIFNDIDDFVMYWSNLLMQVASDSIPNRVVTVHPKEKPWVNADLKKMIRRRNLLWRRYKRSGSADHYATFKLLRNRVVSLTRQLRIVYFSGLGEELSSPTMPGRKWWKTVKQVTGDKVYSGIPTLIENGSPIIDSIEKANIFNEYFASQCQLPDGSNDHPLPPFRYETDERLANITFFP